MTAVMGASTTTSAVIVTAPEFWPLLALVILPMGLAWCAIAWWAGNAQCASDAGAPIAPAPADRPDRTTAQDTSTRKLASQSQRDAALERDLRQALARGEFTLHYQPQYDCRTLELTSAEALIRWHHPQRGMVSPCEFIPVAEQSDLICDIGEWVVREACAMIARLERLGTPLRISVNVSPQQLERAEFVSMVAQALADSQAMPDLLEVEITEGQAMRDCDMAARRLEQLAREDISIAIDDFGIGYSNLACLIRLPVSRLKIDRSLLHEITTRPQVQTLVRTIIGLAHGLGFRTVVEGIETAEQLALVTGMGCDVVQGFYLSRPIEALQLQQLLAAERVSLHPKLQAMAG
jgi:EAL domain-containing protein (putative c-di-GMP-specific phosphodiesterase class I)